MTAQRISIALLASGALTLGAGCGHKYVKRNDLKGEPKVAAVVVYPTNVLYDAPAYEGYYRTQDALRVAVEWGGALVIGPDEFDLFKSGDDNFLVGSTVAFKAGEEGLDPKALVVLRPRLERRRESGSQDQFDASGKKQKHEILHRDTIVATVDILLPDGVAVVLEHSVVADPFAKRPDHDALPEARKALRTLMRAAFTVIDAEMHVARPARTLPFDWQVNPAPMFRYKLSPASKSFEEELAGKDDLTRQSERLMRYDYFFEQPSPKLVQLFEKHPEGGLYIRRAGGGLEAGDLVLRAAGKPITGAQQLHRLLNRDSGKPELEVLRGGEKHTVVLHASAQ